jgi:hypothetical protein
MNQNETNKSGENNTDSEPEQLKEIRLHPWEEFVGIFKRVEITEFDHAVIFEFPKPKDIKVLFSQDSEEARILTELLTPELIGKKIGILRTDIPEKPIVMRLVEPDNIDN